MAYAGRTPGRDRTAIATSIAIHLCVLAALATLPRASFPADDPDERALFASIIRLEHRPPPPHVAPVQRALAASATPRETSAPVVIHAAVTVEHAARRLVVATEQRAAYVPSEPSAHAQLKPAIATTRLALAATQPAVAPAAAPAATAAPLASPAPSPVAAQREDGIGNFGETYPASVEPSLRSALLSVAGSGFDVRVTVDESGRATSIEFVRAPADATLREELRTRLLAARFIPANCNGLRCIGTLELKN